MTTVLSDGGAHGTVSRESVGAAVVVALVAMAGCSVPLLDGDTGQSRDNFDAPERPTGTANSQDTSPLSGSDGVMEGYELASAHRFALEGESFALQRERVILAPNGTILRKDRTLGRVAANRTRYALSEEHWERGQQWVADRYWSPGADRPVVRVREGSDTTEYAEYVDQAGRPLRVTDVLSQDVTFRTRLFRVLISVADDSITRIDQNETSGFVVKGRLENGSWLVGGGPNRTVSNATVLAIVREEGLVDRLRLQYDFRVNGTHRRVVERYQFEIVGSAAVAAPEWLRYVPDSVDRRSVDRERDSVGGPRITGGSSGWGGRNDTESNDSSGSDGVENPHPDRSLVSLPTPGREKRAADGAHRVTARSRPGEATDKATTVP